MGSNKGDLPDKLDLRDADLQGATLGRAQLPGALFSGAHLDYLDVHTGEEPYANFAGAEFKRTSLYGAYFNNADLSEANFDTPIGADGTLRTTQRTDLRHAPLPGGHGHLRSASGGRPALGQLHRDQGAPGDAARSGLQGGRS